MKSPDPNCPNCRGWGYTKGGPNGPWEKLDCECTKDEESATEQKEETK